MHTPENPATGEPHGTTDRCFLISKNSATTAPCLFNPSQSESSVHDEFIEYFRESACLGTGFFLVYAKFVIQHEMSPESSESILDSLALELKKHKNTTMTDGHFNIARRIYLYCQSKDFAPSAWNDGELTEIIDSGLRELFPQSMNMPLNDEFKYAQEMLCAIYDCHRATVGIEDNLIGNAARIEKGYSIIVQKASKYPKSLADAIYTQMEKSYDPNDYTQYPFFTLMAPAWFAFAKEALNSESLKHEFTDIKRRYLIVRESMMHVKTDFGYRSPNWHYGKNQPSILTQSVHPLNIYPGNPTRKIGRINQYGISAIETMLTHVRSVDSVVDIDSLNFYVSGSNALFGYCIMFVEDCADLWTTAVLATARALFDVIIDEHKDFKGAQSAAIALTILLNRYQPIEQKFMDQIVCLLPENGKDLTSHEVINDYWVDLGCRVGWMYDEKNSDYWITSVRFFPQILPAIYETYKTFFIKAIKLSKDMVKQENIDLGLRFAQLVCSMFDTLLNGNLAIRRHEVQFTLELYLNRDTDMKEAAKSFQYWDAFKPAWIEVAMIRSQVITTTKSDQIVQCYDLIRPIVVACRESLACMPLQSKLTLDDIRNGPIFAKFRPTQDPQCLSLHVSLKRTIHFLDVTFTSFRDDINKLPAYEYVLKILDQLYGRNPKENLDLDRACTMLFGIDKYVMDCFLVIDIGGDSDSGGFLYRIIAFVRVLYHMLVDMYGEEYHLFACNVGEMFLNFFCLANEEKTGNVNAEFLRRLFAIWDAFQWDVCFKGIKIQGRVLDVDEQEFSKMRHHV